MSRLTRDGPTEPISRDQILRHERGQGHIQFPVQLTTSRIGNLTRSILTLAICEDRTYIHAMKESANQPIKINLYLYLSIYIMRVRRFFARTRRRTPLAKVVLFCLCFLPIYSGRQVRWMYRPGSHRRRRSHRISHTPSFCGACLYFSREKDSAVPFPRRP